MEEPAAEFLGAFILLAAGGLLVVAPGACLVLGWMDLADRRYEEADTWATLAGLSSVGLAALAGLVGLLAALVQEDDGTMLALVAVPAITWLLSRALHDGIRSRRDAERRARRDARAGTPNT